MEKNDLIYKQDAINSVSRAIFHYPAMYYGNFNNYNFTESFIEDALKFLPAAERNCFTCGMSERVMIFNPEKVSDEILEENDRPVMLSDVCKLIQSEWEVNPKQWGKIRSLPSAEVKNDYK